MAQSGYGPPLLDASTLGNLGNTFWQAEERARKQALEEQKRQTFAAAAQGGDLGKLGMALLGTGDVQGAAALIGLSQKQADRAREAAWETRYGGEFGGAQPAPAQGQQPMTLGNLGAAASQPAQSLIQNESGGNWQAQNNAVGAGGQRGHFGRLQFGQARLQEAAAAGAIPQGTTPQAFMASPELQQRAEAWHFNDIDQFIRGNGLDKTIGRSINGVPVTLDGMRAVAHLGGKEGLAKFIASGGRYNPSDENGTSLMDYLARHGGSGRQPVQVAENEADVQRLESQMAAGAGPFQTAQADVPAPGASPAQGFAIPGGQTDASIANDPRVLNLQRALAGAPERFKPSIQSRLNILVEELKAQRQQSAPTDVQRNYEVARRQGYQGSLLDYQRELRQSTTVNVDTKGEGEYAKTVGKSLGERMDAISKEGDSARQDMAVIGQLRQLGGQIQNLGSGAALQGWLADRGIKVGPNVSEIEAFSALVDKLTPQQRVPGSGASSDLDVRMFKSALPSLIRTPGGNELILTTLEAIAQDKAARAAVADRALTGELKPQEAIKELRSLPDPMAALKEARKSNFKSLPQVQQERRQQENSQFREGQRARGPNGEIIIFRNGQWGAQ